MANDVRTTDEIASEIQEFCGWWGVPFDLHAIHSVLNTFPQFAREPVEYRISTKRPRVLSIRLIDLVSQEDMFKKAVANKLIQPDHLTATIIPDVQQHVSLLGYGVDATADSGVEKIWLFCNKFFPVEQLYPIQSLPPGLKNSDAFLKKFHLTHFNIFGVDFHHDSINLYFPLTDKSFYTAECLLAMISEAGFKWTYDPDLLAYNAKNSKLVALTYSWERDAIERICYYVPETSVAGLPADPTYRELISPLRPGAAFIVGTTCGHRSNYLKLEFKYGIYENVVKCLALERA